MPFDFDLTTLLIAVPIVLASLVLHELGHAAVAALLGDHTARMAGRLTLNPLKHLDPLGTLAILWTMTSGFGFGWAKPVSINPLNLRFGPKNGMALVAAAGPAVNLLLALIAVFLLQTLRIGTLLTVTPPAEWLSTAEDVLFAVIGVNVGLTIFNLLPIPPLDGSKVIGALMPDPLWFRYLRLEAWGFGILMVILMIGYFGPISVLSMVMAPAARGLLGAMADLTAGPAALVAQLFV